jgi:hypothetical protein
LRRREEKQISGKFRIKIDLDDLVDREWTSVKQVGAA